MARIPIVRKEYTACTARPKHSLRPSRTRAARGNPLVSEVARPANPHRGVGRVGEAAGGPGEGQPRGQGPRERPAFVGGLRRLGLPAVRVDGAHPGNAEEKARGQGQRPLRSCSRRADPGQVACRCRNRVCGGTAAQFPRAVALFLNLWRPRTDNRNSQHTHPSARAALGLKGAARFFERRRKWLKRSGVSLLCFGPVALQIQETARCFRSRLAVPLYQRPQRKGHLGEKGEVRNRVGASKNADVDVEMVEAVGIEPTSGCPGPEASTRVVDPLNLGPQGSDRQDPGKPSQALISPATRPTDVPASPCVDVRPRSTGRPRRT
jgi:hypothetical protein